MKMVEPLGTLLTVDALILVESTYWHADGEDSTKELAARMDGK